MIRTGPLINEGAPSPGIPGGFKLGGELGLLLGQIVLFGGRKGQAQPSAGTMAFHTTG